MLSYKKGAKHTDQISRLNRIEGQVRGISRMIEEQRYCMEILDQIKAVKSAISSVERNVVEEHLNQCMLRSITERSDDEIQEMLKEIKSFLKNNIKNGL